MLFWDGKGSRATVNEYRVCIGCASREHGRAFGDDEGVRASKERAQGSRGGSIGEKKESILTKWALAGEQSSGI